MRLLRRIFLHDFGLKLFAVLISFFLWSTYTAEPYAEIAYTVPIAFVNLPPGLAVTGDVPASVHVLLRGRSGLLRRMVPADLTFTVDLGNAHAGAMPVHLTTSMVTVPYGTEVVRIFPAEFRLSLITDSTPPGGGE